MRAIRGATTVEENRAEQILEATRELLQKIVALNQIEIDDIVSVIFSMTRDLNAVFPAAAARQMGWKHVPLMCFSELEVPGALPRCIRVMLFFNTSRSQQELRPVYLKEASRLREDL